MALDAVWPMEMDPWSP